MIASPWANRFHVTIDGDRARLDFREAMEANQAAEDRVSVSIRIKNAEILAKVITDLIAQLKYQGGGEASGSSPTAH